MTHEQWLQLEEVTEALLDTEGTGIRCAEIMVNGEAFGDFAMIDVEAGEIDEARYDLIRQVVGEYGGRVLILSRDNGRNNLRVWPQRES